jgi:predicted AlkP superfamily phosphohydrolase/phosphomutase
MLWKYFDRTHRLNEPGNEFENIVQEYYIMLDRLLGEILGLLDDDTVVLVASDHGGKPMKGAFCINQWLIDQGYLKIKGPVENVSSFMNVEVDWEKTVAWGWGGYYSRIFLNVKGREPSGIIDPRLFEEKRNEIMKKLLSIKGPDGESWETRVLKPDMVYKECKGDPPDLMVYLDNLNWRSAGTIGHDVIYLKGNDNGLDDAVHDIMGAYIFYDPKENYNGQMTMMDILDVTPTLLKSMKLLIPEKIIGKPNSILCARK